MEKVPAMILAGGRGKRMGVLCQERPKPALPFAGRFRVIDFSLSNCIHSGLGPVSVLVDYQRSSMVNYLQRWSLANGGDGGFKVLEPGDGCYLGTADAVYQNLAWLQAVDAGEVIIAAADHVYKMDYRKMLEFHRRSGADATVAVISVPIEQAHRFGIVNAGADGRITGFQEKPFLPRSNLVSMGIYIFDRRVLAQRLVEDAAQPDSPHDFGHAIIPAMVGRDRLFAYQFDGYWRDVGNAEAYYTAQMDLLSPQPAFSMNGSWSVLACDQEIAPVRKSQQAQIKNSIISPGCVIKGTVENSVLSPGVWVEEKAVVRDSVVMSNTFIGYHSLVDHCILDESANLGGFCYVGFGVAKSHNNGHRGVTVVGKSVTVPSHTAIGRECIIPPHAGPGDFLSNVIESGSASSAAMSRANLVAGAGEA
ncbi:MAG: NTP transferase domain-containing protein [Chloroflexi bacterium]|nr:NTP transferase domain-containing protein [Chloroflexota bacterium]